MKNFDEKTRIILIITGSYTFLYMLVWFVSDNANFLYTGSKFDWLSRVVYVFFGGLFSGVLIDLVFKE